MATRDDVTLSYIGQLHEAFTSARAYAGRVLTLMLLVSVLIVAMAVDPGAGGSKAKIATLELSVSALMLGGSLFLVVAPGVAIGRMLRMRLLRQRITSLFVSIDGSFRNRAGADLADPYDMPGLLAEASLAYRRSEANVGSKWRRRWDLVGAAAAGIVILAFPLTAQTTAMFWWLDHGPGKDGLVIAVAVALIVATIASVRIGWGRWHSPDYGANVKVPVRNASAS